MTLVLPLVPETQIRLHQNAHCRPNPQDRLLNGSALPSIPIPISRMSTDSFTENSRAAKIHNHRCPHLAPQQQTLQFHIFQHVFTFVKFSEWEFNTKNEANTENKSVNDTDFARKILSAPLLKSFVWQNMAHNFRVKSYGAGDGCYNFCEI